MKLIVLRVYIGLCSLTSSSIDRESGILCPWKRYCLEHSADLFSEKCMQITSMHENLAYVVLPGTRESYPGIVAGKVKRDRINILSQLEKAKWTTTQSCKSPSNIIIFCVVHQVVKTWLIPSNNNSTVNVWSRSKSRIKKPWWDSKIDGLEFMITPMVTFTNKYLQKKKLYMTKILCYGGGHPRRWWCDDKSLEYSEAVALYQLEPHNIFIRSLKTDVKISSLPLDFFIFVLENLNSGSLQTPSLEGHLPQYPMRSGMETRFDSDSSF